MGIVRAYQKGTLKTPPSPEVQGVATSMKKSDVEKFASTKHKGLPEKVSKVSESNGEEEIKKYLENQKSPSDAAEEKIKAYRQKNPRKKGPFAPMDKFKASKSRMKYRQTGPDDVKEERKDTKGQNHYSKKDPLKNSNKRSIKLDDLEKTVSSKPTAKEMLDSVRKKQQEIQNEDYVKELEDGLVKMDYPTYDEVDELMKKIAKENDIDTTTLHMAFKTKHLMVPDDWAKKKMFEPVMIPKTPENMSCEGITAKDRFSRDAGKIAKKKLRKKEHNKYVNFLDVDEAVNAAQQAAIAISKKNRLQDLKVAKKRKLKKEDYEPINELSQETMASAAKEAMKKRDNARGTPEYGRRQKQVLKFVAGAVKKRQQRDSVERSFKKPDAKRTPTMEGNSIQESPTLVGAVTYKKSEKPGKFEKAGRVVGGIGGSIAGGTAGTAAGGPLGGLGGSIAGDVVGTRAGGNVGQKIDKLTRKQVKEEGLRDWFGKSKSKDGKGGWVNVVTGGTCASDKPGEGTPKCVSSSKRASMTKAERLSAQRRKKAADPGQQSKKNAAKPTYVSTDSPKKKKKVNESAELKKAKINFNTSKKGGKTIYKVNKNDEADAQKAMKNDPKYISGKTRVQAHQEAYGGKGVSRKAKLMSTHPPTAQAAIKNIPTETDRGAGNKAKRRSGQKVEKKSPSYKAYINNKEEYINEAGARVGRKFTTGKIGKQYTRDEYGDPIKKDGSSALKKNVDKNPKDDKTPNNLVGEEKKIKNKLKKTAKELDAAVVMHTKQAKRLRAIVEDGRDLTGNFEKGDKPVKVNIKNLVDKAKKNPKNKNIGVKPPTTTSEAIEMTRKAYKKLHKDFKSDDPKNPRTTKYVDGKGTVSMPVKFVDEGKKPMIKVKLKDPSQIKVKVTDIGAGGKEYVRKDEMKNEGVEQIDEFKRSPAWQRKAGKSESGGLNAKGVASYRRANPGSKLKTAVTTKPSKLKKGSKSAKRRLSFCRRMRGMKKKLTSAKTARDPNSRINKSLRKWNCSFEYESGQMIIERGPQSLGSGARQKSIHAKEGKKGTKKVSGMIKSLKRKGSILKQPLGGPADAASKARRLSYVKAGDDVDLTILRLMNEGHMNKTCAKGEYYCYNSKKCKPIPKGMRIGYGGMLKPENENDESNGKKGGSNGNGNGNGGNGNGNGGNGNGGNGGGE